MTAGVRQGCPLSPLLYAVCADLLLERIRTTISTAVTRAYADDTAVIIQDILAEAPILAQIFQEFGNISNLHLNINKTVVIPLFPTPGIAATRDNLIHLIPTWSNVQLEYYAKYLGFMIGPDSSCRSWKDPTEKYQQRATTWTNLHLGLHCTAVSYNTFALPVLTYIAQLGMPPPEVLEAEHNTLLKMAPGPTAWITPSDLWWLRHLTGHPCSLLSLKIYSQAAQTRVRIWDPACADQENDPGTPMEILPAQQGATRAQRSAGSDRHNNQRARLHNNYSLSSSFQQRISHLRSLIRAPNQFYAKALWSDWFHNSANLSLDQNLHYVQDTIGTIQQYLPTNYCIETKEDAQEWKTMRRKFQSKIYASLHDRAAPDTQARFSHKLDRWNLHLPTQPLHDHMSVRQRTPNWQARCAHQRLKTLAKLTTPRVHAAVFGATWNRWCTRRRYQQRGRCRLCQQPHSEDSIEHYAYCSSVRKLAAQRLRLCCTTQVNIHTFTCTNPLLRTQEQLTRAALLIYSTYRALNHQRQSKNPLQADELYNAMCQWVVEGARGHTRTCQTLAKTWTEHQGTPLPKIQ